MTRLFVADDEDEIRNGICENIDWAAHDITVCGQADNGLSALEQMMTLKPDVAVLDIRMPKISGLDLLEAIRASIPKTKVIILSGYDDFSYAQRALRAGVVDYLLKPCRSNDILKAVLKAVQSSRPDQTLSAADLFEPVSGASRSSKMIQIVKEGQREELEPELRRIFDAEEDISAIKKFAFNLINRLSYLCVRRNLSPYQEPSWCREQMFTIISDESSEHIRESLLEACQSVWDAVHPGDTENLIIRKTVAYLQEHYSEHVNLNFVAEKMFINPKYLSYLFKQTIGVSFTDYIQNLRLEKACQLLKDKNYKIYEIAAMVGYNDVKYFFSIFKKNLGITPTQYRNKNMV